MSIPRHFFYACITLLVLIIQISILQFWNSPPPLFLVIALGTLYLASKDIVFTFSHMFVVGVVLDVFSPMQFGTHAVLLVVSLTLGTILLQTLLSQRSTVSLFTLGALLTLLYALGLHVAEYISTNSKIGYFQAGYFLDILIAALVTGIIVALTYKLSSLRRSYKLKPYMIR